MIYFKNQGFFAHKSRDFYILYDLRGFSDSINNKTLDFFMINQMFLFRR